MSDPNQNNGDNSATGSTLGDYLMGEAKSSSPPVGDPRLLKLFKRHGPGTWQEQIGYDRLAELVQTGRPTEMIVLAADIRKSTYVMKETIDFKKFADALSHFVTVSARFIRYSNGWFDKFTGDGLLAYWICDNKSDFRTHLESAMRVSHHILSTFQGKVMRDLKTNCRNFPAGVGLTVGLDAGPTYLVKVAGDLTIVGPAVVGAVRMVDAGKQPWTTMCNVHIGDPLFEMRDELMRERGIEIHKDFGSTKEYDAQEAYKVIFTDLRYE